MDKAQDFVVLFLLANVGVGVAENELIGVLHEERQHSLPPAAAFGELIFIGDYLESCSQVKSKLTINTFGIGAWVNRDD